MSRSNVRPYSLVLVLVLTVCVALSSLHETPLAATSEGTETEPLPYSADTNPKETSSATSRFPKQDALIESDHSSFLPIVSTSTREERMNVLVILVDDASYGQYLNAMPNLQAYAGRSATFGNAAVNATRCNPSRVSMWLGMLPSRTCVTRNEGQEMWRDRIAQCGDVGSDITTLFQELDADGYYTSAIGKVTHSPWQQAEEPFDFEDWNAAAYVIEQNLMQDGQLPLHGILDFYAVTKPTTDWGVIDGVLDKNGNPMDESDLRDYGVANMAIEQIQMLSEPFALFVGFGLPHSPAYVPDRLYQQYEDLPLPNVLWNDLEDVPDIASAGINESGFNPFTQHIMSNHDVWRDHWIAFNAAAAFADEQAQRVLDALADNGHANDTVVVITSDHGAHHGEKLRNGKSWLWTLNYHVPLIIHYPGESPVFVDSPVQIVDLFPTILEATAVPHPTDYERDGRSLLPFVRGEIDSWNRWQFVYFGDYGATSDGVYNYIEYSEDEFELYHLPDDPNEWRNLALLPEYAAIVQLMSDTLEQQGRSQHFGE